MSKNKINILLVEDNVIIADDLHLLLEEIGYHVIAKAISYEGAIEILENERVDLAFIDINLATKYTGIDLAHKINKSFKLPFIYLTSYSDKTTIENASVTMPYGYLVKPFEEKNIKATIEVALMRFNQLQNEETKDRKDFFFVKKRDIYEKILFDCILYIKSDNVYVEIYTKNNKKYLHRAALKNFQKLLPSNFYKSNKSYIINIDYVEKFTLSHVIINNVKIIISKDFKPVLKSLLM